MNAAGSYQLIRSSDSAAAFHARVVPEPPRPELWWHDVIAPALVLGSSQADAVVDREACGRRGVDVVRRRSGGGAVLLTPGEVSWLDVIVPVDSMGWSLDVHQQMVWLGRHLAAAIASLVDEERSIQVHDGPMLTTDWSSQVCFDGVGAGEVLLDGRKLVGISQRRTRHAARLQCCWYSAYDPNALVALLRPSHRPEPADLSAVATLPAPLAAAVPQALLDRLHLER